MFFNKNNINATIFGTPVCRFVGSNRPLCADPNRRHPRWIDARTLQCVANGLGSFLRQYLVGVGTSRGIGVSLDANELAWILTYKLGHLGQRIAGFRAKLGSTWREGLIVE